MARLAPFRGVRYALPPLQQCVAPPYDVVSPSERELLRRFPYNIIHLTLPDRYDEAARLWTQWQQEGMLQVDPSATMYLLEQVFPHPVTGERHRRLALICVMALEEYGAGVVLPHEHTQPRVKEDRLHLLRATEANLEPVYGLIEGEMLPLLEELTAACPLMAEVEYADGLHRLYRVEREEAIPRLVEQAAPARVWIADGHHRYETCLRYRQERRAAEGNPAGLRSYDWFMVALTPLEDPGVVILPTHRVLLQASEDALALLPQRLEQWFRVLPSSPQRAAQELREGVPRRGFAVVFRSGQAYTAWLREDVAPEQLVPAGHSIAYRQLDVTLLQHLVLEPLLGVTAGHLERAEGIRYTRDEREALECVLRGEGAIAFLLNPPTVQEVREVALAGEKMPPKSTYFYPKLLSGLLMRSLRC